MPLLPQIIGGQMMAGSKPVIPENVNAGEVQLNAVRGNEATLGRAQGLTSQVNMFNQQQLTQMLEQAIPGFRSLQESTLGNIQSQLRGELPQDVVDSISRNNAQLAQQGGFSGSGMQAARTSRDLGLSSLQLIDNAMNSASRYIAQARQTQVAPTFDVTSMFFSPQQRLAQANLAFERDLLRAGVAAAPDPKKAALGQAILNTDAQVMELASSAMGMMGGMCWVAREVYGPENPKWLQFRDWVLNKAPAWFRSLYRKFGESFAKWVSDKPKLKHVIRIWMDQRIKSYGN